MFTRLNSQKQQDILGTEVISEMRSLTLEIPPDWNAIDGLRNRVISFLKEGNEGQALVDGIAMVVSELTENAIKYGRFGATDQVHLTVDVAPGAITVEV